MCNGTYIMYVNGKRISSDVILNNIGGIINKNYSALFFPHGMESVKAFQSETMTFFANKNFKALSLQMLQKRTRDELMEIGGYTRPARNIFLDGENNLITETCELTESAKNGDSWLNEICNEVDLLVEAGKKKYTDRFSLSDLLSPLMRPPYGLFPNPANYAVLGYALRKHKDDLFNPSTSQPVGDEKLNDMIETLLKMWDLGISETSNKLLLRFGSVEERNLTSLLGEVFNLGAVKGVSLADLKSLTYAKWSITEFCKQTAKYPLWSLLYCEKMKSKENCAKALQKLIDLFNQESFSLPKIKEILREMKAEQIDLYKIVTIAENYHEGFINFINQIEGIEINPEWSDELEEELTHMQSEIAFRKKEDVEKRVMLFYINKTKKHDSEEDNDNETNDGGQNGTNNSGSTTSGGSSTKKVTSEEEVKKAKNLVKEQTMPSMMWQKVVLDLIEEHPDVSNFIITYLGS